MPLPAGDRTTEDLPWPPPWINPVLDKIDEWSAWYSGDPNRLHHYYGGPKYLGAGTEWIKTRPSQHRGGLVGAIARGIWGPPAAKEEGEYNLHIALAGDIATMSADLLLGERPAIKFDADEVDQASKDALDRLIKDGLYANLREGAEICAAKGDVYLVSAWDKETHDLPWTAIYPAEVAVPEFAYTRLSAVTFWRVLRKENNNTVWRHLERHDKGAISHALYEGTAGRLGRRVELTALGADFPDMQLIADALTDGDTIETGIDRLTVEKVPNMLPNRVFDHLPGTDRLGRSDFQGVENPMAALDGVWTSWMRDIRLGRSRLVVSPTAAKSLGRGNGAMFDTDRELLLGLNTSPNADEDPLEMIQFIIRVEEHERTARALIEQIIHDSGYSIQDYSGTTEGTAITATEVTQKRRRSLMTRDKKIEYWRPAIAGAITTQLALMREHFGISIAEGAIPMVEFPDGVSESPQEIANTLQTLETAKAISTRTKVEMAHPDWQKERVDDEVAELLGSDLARKAEALATIGQALTAMGTAIQLGVVSADRVNDIIEQVIGMDADVTEPPPPEPPPGQEFDDDAPEPVAAR